MKKLNKKKRRQLPLLTAPRFPEARSPGIKAINKSILEILLRQADRKSDDKDQYSNCDNHTDDDENHFLKQNTTKRVTTEQTFLFFSYISAAFIVMSHLCLPNTSKSGYEVFNNLKHSRLHASMYVKHCKPMVELINAKHLM